MDREKITVYAEAGVEEYWLVLPERRQLERFAKQVKGNYQEAQIYSYDDTVELLSPIRLEVNLVELS